MRDPMVVIVAFRRALETVLGSQTATVTYGGYLDRLARAGARPVIVAPGTRVPDLVVEHMDGLLLTGGGDVDPERFGSRLPGRDLDLERDDLEVELVRGCHERRIPVLGLCRGAQVLNVALDGTLHSVKGHVQQEPLAEPVHTVRLRRGCRLATATGETALAVNSFHRWAVQAPAEGFAVAATAQDGVVEAIEWDAHDWFAVGVQWHAELLETAHVEALFAGFTAAAGRRAAA